MKRSLEWAKDFPWLASKVAAEVAQTIRRPRRLRWIRDKAVLRRQLRAVFRKDAPWRLVDKNVPWVEASEELGPLKQRRFDSYADYVRLQREKLSIFELEVYDQEFSRVLVERLHPLDFIVPGKVCLCLAARLGTEVRAFRELGLFSVGIDLNPGEKNRYVLHGDFHDLQFPSDSVDVVYTNSLDHALDLTKLLSEVNRVLRTGGTFLVEAMKGTETPEGFGDYETLWWGNVDALVDVICKSGFALESRREFDYPWVGEQLILVRIT
jgi:SAM-dependent methyltransferase